MFCFLSQKVCCNHRQTFHLDIYIFVINDVILNSKAALILLLLLLLLLLLISPASHSFPT